MSLAKYFDNNPVLTAIVPPAASATVTTILLAFAGIGFLIAALEFTGVRRGRVAWFRCARQVAVLSLVLGWVLLVGIRVWLFLSSDGYVPQSFLSAVVELSWGALGLAVVTASLHFALWKPLENHRTIHAWLAVLIGLNGLLAAAALMGSLRMMTALDLPNAAEITLADLYSFRTFASPLVSAAVLLVPLCLAMPAAAAALWLPARRNRDNFGRDYYNTMLPWCCRWAFAVWAVVTVLSVLVVAAEAMAAGAAAPSLPRVLLWAARILPPVAACVIFGLASRAAVPMRWSSGLIAAFVCGMPSAFFLYRDVTTFIF